MNVTKHGDTALTVSPPTGGNMVTCSVDGCDRAPRARGLCLMHYRRQRRHGDTARRPSGRLVIDGKSAIVNKLFHEWSPRTRERYTRAWRLLELAGIDIQTILPKVTRPNGTMSVQRLLEIADDEVAKAIVFGKLILAEHWEPQS